MRGLRAYGAYLPRRRLDRADIRAVMGSGGGRGMRTVAGFDEDTTTMAFEAARHLLGDSPRQPVDAVWFATAEPAYLEKTNANVVHAALRLPTSARAVDMGGAVRSGVGALLSALDGSGEIIVAASGIRTGLPTGADESAGGDGAAAFLVGDGTDDDLVAVYLGGASATEEFVDRWRIPGDRHTRTWEERYAETRYGPLLDTAWKAALADAGLAPDDVAAIALAGAHARSVTTAARRLGAAVADGLTDSVGNTGAAHPGVVLASVLDTAEPGQVVALVSLADGADVALFRTTSALATNRQRRTVAAQLAATTQIAYPTFLQWRQMIEVQPPNRPAPARVSSSAASRNLDWKYGLVAVKGATSGIVHLPPSRVSVSEDDAVDAMEPVPMADAVGTIVTLTVDRLVYSLSPPVVFAVVDFDGGGRLPVELTDVAASDVAIGDRVELTFRRLATADGIHNYFWKARPLVEEA